MGKQDLIGTDPLKLQVKGTMLLNHQATTGLKEHLRELSINLMMFEAPSLNVCTNSQGTCTSHEDIDRPHRSNQFQEAHQLPSIKSEVHTVLKGSQRSENDVILCVFALSHCRCYRSKS